MKPPYSLDHQYSDNNSEALATKTRIETIFSTSQKQRASHSEALATKTRIETLYQLWLHSPHFDSEALATKTRIKTWFLFLLVHLGMMKLEFQVFLYQHCLYVYLGKWNYRAIHKVKTWSYFLTIPKWFLDPVGEVLIWQIYDAYKAWVKNR